MAKKSGPANISEDQNILHMTHDNQKESLNEDPSISIVIPCYNEAKGVVRSLDEIFETLNEKNDFEIIAINDGSTDKTLVLLEECALQRPQLHVINNIINLGYGASLKKRNPTS